MGPARQPPWGGAARAALVCAALLALAGCASQIPAAVAEGEGTPGFLWGLWHGFIFPWAWIGSLFDEGIAVYAVPNNGGWYDFGYFLGVTVLGGGSWFGSKARRRD
jgi:hydrogenase/urease accessory protein HupE